MTRGRDVDPLEEDVEESEDGEDDEEERRDDGDGDEAEDDVDRDQVEEEDNLTQNSVDRIHVFGEPAKRGLDKLLKSLMNG